MISLSNHPPLAALPSCRLFTTCTSCCLSLYHEFQPACYYLGNHSSRVPACPGQEGNYGCVHSLEQPCRALEWRASTSLRWKFRIIIIIVFFFRDKLNPARFTHTLLCNPNPNPNRSSILISSLWGNRGSVFHLRGRDLSSSSIGVSRPAWL